MKKRKADPINNPQFSKASILSNHSLSLPRASAGPLTQVSRKKKSPSSQTRPRDSSSGCGRCILSLPILYLADFMVLVFVSTADRNSLRDPCHANKSCPHHTSPKAFIILYIITRYPGILSSNTSPHVGKLK